MEKVLLEELLELENIRHYKVIGSLVRSRSKWINEGKNPTNYFLNLENHHYTSKIIPKILLSENNEQIEIVKQEDSLNELENFYKKKIVCNDSRKYRYFTK